MLITLLFSSKIECSCCFIFMADSLCYKIKFSCSWDRNAWRSPKPDLCVEGYFLQSFFIFFVFLVLSFWIFLPWLYEPFSSIPLLSPSLVFVKFLPVFKFSFFSFHSVYFLMTDISFHSPGESFLLCLDPIWKPPRTKTLPWLNWPVTLKGKIKYNLSTVYLSLQWWLQLAVL